MKFIINVLLLLVAIFNLVEDANADWGDFRRQHVLNPKANDERGYTTWNRAQWNTWLQLRLADAYGTKEINSIMVGEPAQIKADFQHANLKHDAANNLYWSEDTYPIYIERLVRPRPGKDGQPSYNVFNCGKQYVLAGIVGYGADRAPVHFHRSSPAGLNRPTTGNVQTDWKRCVKIN